MNDPVVCVCGVGEQFYSLEMNFKALYLSMCVSVSSVCVFAVCVAVICDACC